MKRLFTVLISLVIVFSCSSRKQIEKALYKGDYDTAMDKALKKLETNLDAKNKRDFVLMLGDAYDLVQKKDLERIAFFKKDNNPENYKRIFETYLALDKRQERIKPLMPLYADGKRLVFLFNDYSNDIIEYKNKTSDHLYRKAEQLIGSRKKSDARSAHAELSYVKRINPNYKKTQELIDLAHVLGTDFVLVHLVNNTNQMIPLRLEQDLLNFDTYGLNDLWEVYHSQPDERIHYDYAMTLEFKQINITPERINEREKLREKEIVDGWEYLLDANGNVAKDSLGNDIKVDKIVKVRARFFEVQQHKAVQVLGRVSYVDLNTNQPLSSFPLDVGFVFEHFFGRYKGDERALTQEDKEMLRQPELAFPSNEQMVFDAGETLKNRLREIIVNKRF